MSHWAYKYADYIMRSADIVSGESNCILNGFEDGTFRPDNNVTIIQLLKMAICSLGEDGYMAEAVENGGYSERLQYGSGKIRFQQKYCS